MGIITVVDGLEMFAYMRGPGSAQCDGCGKILTSVREDLFDDMCKAGWTHEGDGHIGSPAWCPDCAV